MQEFIDSFGKNNLMIIVAVIGAIILALIIIMIIEKIDNKKRNNNDEVDYYEEDKKDDSFEEIVYIDDEPTEEEAKQTLEEVQKKLVSGEYDNDTIGRTHFELEQEEKAIISYDELKNASIDFDSENDKLLDDDGSEPISIDELYKLHVEENDKEAYENPLYDDIDEIINQEVVYNEEKVDERLENEVKQEISIETKKVSDEKKFKNSEVISPVFGIYKQEQSMYRRVAPKREEVKKREIDDIELEIEKTQEFLEELKSLRNKLN